MEKNEFVPIGDSKLEFMTTENEKNSLYTHPNIRFAASKYPYTTKQTIIGLIICLTIIFLIALTAALAKGNSCRRRSLASLDEYDRTNKGSIVKMYGERGTDLFPGYTLPNTIYPLDYQVTLTPEWTLGPNVKTRRVKSFRGRVILHFKALVDSNHLILNNKDLRFVSVSLRPWDQLVATQDHVLTDVIYDDDRYEMVRINTRPGNPIYADRNYTLEIEYAGNVSKTTNGFYTSTYTNSQGQKVYLLSTQFEPNYARRAFPCLDEPAFKSQFTMAIDRPAGGGMKSLSNMPLNHSFPITDPVNGNSDLVRDTFVQSVRMSTYLVAFVICDFDSVHRKLANVTVGVYVPSDQIDQAEFALDTASKGLEFYENYFKIPFPLPKIDLIAIPDFSVGAMENWGLITYRMVDLLYKPNVTSEQQKERVTIVITHELAHQWFGNLVTMSWWDDLWLNEGFATYMEYVSTNSIFPTWAMAMKFTPDTAPSALFLDAFSGSHPVSHARVRTPTDMQSMFDAISYNKGSLLLRMLDGIILRKRDFRDGLHSYLTKHIYSNAKSADLWDALQRAQSSENGAVNPFQIAETTPVSSNTSNQASNTSFDDSDPSIVFIDSLRIVKTVLPGLDDKGRLDNPLAHINVQDVMEGWITQKGFPIVHISDPKPLGSSDLSKDAISNANTKRSSSYSIDDYVVDIYQTKFQSQFNTLAKSEQAATPSWQIPLTLLIGRANKPREQAIKATVWMKGANVSHPLTGAAGLIETLPVATDGSINAVSDIWIKGNIDYSGYYYVNYGPQLWDSLMAQIKTNASFTSPLDRIQLIDQTFSLARFGYIPYVKALDFSLYANAGAFDKTAKPTTELNEKHALALDILLSTIAMVRRYFKFTNLPEAAETYKDRFPQFIRKLALDHLLAKYAQWKTSQELPVLETSLQTRVVILAIAFGDNDTIAKTRPYFQQWIYDHSNQKTHLPYPELAGAILRAGIEYGNQSDWEFAWKAYKSSNVPSEKNSILQSLVYTKDSNLLDRLLGYVYNGIKTAHPVDDNYIRNQDCASVIVALSSSSPISTASSTAWNFVKKNWDLLLETYGDSSSTLSNLIRGICKNFDTPELRDDYLTFAERALRTASITNDSIIQTREIIDLNIAFVQNNGQNIIDWLKAKL